MLNAEFNRSIFCFYYPLYNGEYKYYSTYITINRYK